MDYVLKALADSGNQAVMALLLVIGVLLMILREVHRSSIKAMAALTEVITQLRLEVAKWRQ